MALVEGEPLAAQGFAFQPPMDGLLARDLGVERDFNYVVTREVRSAKPDTAKLTA